MWNDWEKTDQYANKLFEKGYNIKIVTIKELKKYDRFVFNGKEYKVKSKFCDWKHDDNPYLKTYCGESFFFDALPVCQIFNTLEIPFD